jgi:hypothetical protein
MAHRGLFSGAVVSKPVAKKKAPKSKPKQKSEKIPQAKKPKWGTPEEKYRRLCMLILFTRFTYYCKHTEVIDEHQYNRLERLTLEIENKHRELIHPNSPTGRPGSTVETEYPRSVQDLWYCHEDSPDTFAPLRSAIDWFMDDAACTFGIDESKYLNNSGKTS